MTLYYAQNGGIKINEIYLLKEDQALVNASPSFNKKVGVEPESLIETFFGDGFQYLLEAVSSKGIRFYVVTHPETTYSCQDKINLYNEYGCGKNLEVSGNGLPHNLEWRIEDTVKAIYFLDNRTDGIILSIIPGKLPGTFVDIETFGIGVSNLYHKLNPYSDNTVNVESTVEVAKKQGKAVYYSNGAIDIGSTVENALQKDDKGNDTAIYFTKSGRKKRVRLYPVGEKPLFGVGVEGALSPFPPNSYYERGVVQNTDNSLSAIFIDEALLVNPNNLVDLSISSKMIHFPPGAWLEQKVDYENANELMQVIHGEKTRVQIDESNGRYFCNVFGPIINGDYRERTTLPREGQAYATLMHHMLPHHRISVLINAKDMVRILNGQFSNVFTVPYRYEIRA